MLYVVDLENGLIESFMNHEDKKFERWEILPGIKETVQKALTAGDQFAIISNQGGAAFHKVTELQVIEKMGQVIKAAGLPADTPGFYCLHHPKGFAGFCDPVELRRRMPNPGMILEALTKTNMHSSEAIVVSDFSEGKDAAKRAECKYAKTLQDAFRQAEQMREAWI